MDATNGPASHPDSKTLHFVDTTTAQPNMAKQERNNADIEQSAALLKGAPLEWEPSMKEWMIFMTLAIISLMVSLDATVIITSLSVCTYLSLFMALQSPPAAHLRRN